MAGKQGGKGKSSKKDKASRKRYHAEGHREENKERRKAKHGAPNNGSVWAEAKAARHRRKMGLRPKVQ